MMVRAAADDVRFLLFIYHKMLEKLNERSLWYLAVRGALYCRCFCTNDNQYADWPSLPPVPGLFSSSAKLRKYCICFIGQHMHTFVVKLFYICQLSFGLRYI